MGREMGGSGGGGQSQNLTFRPISDLTQNNIFTKQLMHSEVYLFFK